MNTRKLIIKCLGGLLALVTVFAMAGCSSQSYQTHQPITTASTPTTNAPIDTKKSNSTTNAPIDTKKSNWIVESYNDQFGNKTGEKVLQYLLYDGRFSNSATTNSRLAVSVLVDKEHVQIRLAEYGSQIVKNAGSKAINYTIEVQCDNGKVVDLKGFIGSGMDSVYLWPDDLDGTDYGLKFINLLKSNDNLSIYMYPSDRKIQNYNFKIETYGFKDAYNKL